MGNQLANDCTGKPPGLDLALVDKFDFAWRQAVRSGRERPRIEDFLERAGAQSQQHRQSAINQSRSTGSAT